MRRRLRANPALLGLAATFALCLLVVGLGRTSAPEPATDPPRLASSPLVAGDWQVGELSEKGLLQVPGASTPEPAPETPPGTPSALPEPEVAPRQPVTTPSAPPTRVRIGAIDLDERLIGLGIARDGTMQVPRDPDRVGWFTGGGRPGGPGPTVVVGHVDSRTGPAVFARLSELAPGDRVTVATRSGSHDYVVTEARNVSQDDFPTTQVFGATHSDVLRLITCSGPYDHQAGRYTENRVVTAVPA